MNKKNISAGVFHSLAIQADGSLWSWGDNSHGSLGDGTNVDSNRPIKVMNEVAYVSAEMHSTAISTDGKLWSWGVNGYGKSRYCTSTERWTPTYAMDNISKVSASGNYTMAITNENLLWGWSNDWGCQIGNCTNLEDYKPVLIMSDIAEVCASNNCTMAISVGGTLFGWSLDYNGQLLGCNATHRVGRLWFDDAAEIRSVFQIRENVRKVVVGTKAMLITADNELLAWDTKEFYEHSQGDVFVKLDTKDNVQKPKRVMANIKDVSIAYAHALAIDIYGGLWSWGRNRYGELGDGTYISRPEPLKIMEDVVSISVGDNHSMAVTSDGCLWTWGENHHGQLGIGNTSVQNSNRPIKVMDNIMLP